MILCIDHDRYEILHDAHIYTLLDYYFHNTNSEHMDHLLVGLDMNHLLVLAFLTPRKSRVSIGGGFATRPMLSQCPGITVLNAGRPDSDPS